MPPHKIKQKIYPKRLVCWYRIDVYDVYDVIIGFTLQLCLAPQTKGDNTYFKEVNDSNTNFML